MWKYIRQLYKKFQHKFLNVNLNHVAAADNSEQTYFSTAKSWADDIYTQAIVSRNRYRVTCFVGLLVIILALIAIDSLIPLQHIQPLIINHYQDGHAAVQVLHQIHAPPHIHQVESDIVRYVVNRESYDAFSYDSQYALINLLSSRQVALAYQQQQAANNPMAPINTLKNDSFRTVHVDSVIFLDHVLNKRSQHVSLHHHNLAQVTFTIIEHNKNYQIIKRENLIALISWQYHSMPDDPQLLWRNYDGFVVTHYRVMQRNTKLTIGGV